jgi:methyl-accepting chemotaxis protein
VWTSALLLGGAVGAWSGGWLGLLGAAALSAGVAAALRSSGLGTRVSIVSEPGPKVASPVSPARASSVAHAYGSRRPGAEVMVEQVVPVWSRQLEVTRDLASDGLGQILQAFSEINTALQALTSNLASFKVTAQTGAVDNAVRAASPALQALTAASTRAFVERDAAVAELGHCSAGLTELQQLAKQARELARHTRLVAFNASIESNRQPAGGSSPGGASAAAPARGAHGHQSGGQAVASELRMLAGRIGETGERIERVVNGLAATVRKARREGELGQTAAEALPLEIDLCARAALAALLAELGGSVHSGGEARQAAATLSDQLETIFVHFQFGDRVSQMLSIVANDMGNFKQWVADHPLAAPNDAAEWLAALESSYTMEEQRSVHHGNVHVDASTAVEFF